MPKPRPTPRLNHPVPCKKHKWGLAGYGKDQILFYCACGQRFARRPTKAERAWIKRNPLTADLKAPRSRNVHYVAHQFHKTFGGHSGSLKWSGAELGERVEKWAKKYPDDVRIAYCDDENFASSTIVLIEHKHPTQYMGTTVVVIPQTAGASFSFFLYPGHRQSLQNALAAIAKTTVHVKKLEHKAMRARQAERRRVFTFPKPTEQASAPQPTT